MVGSHGTAFCGCILASGSWKAGHGITGKMSHMHGSRHSTRSPPTPLTSPSLSSPPPPPCSNCIPGVSLKHLLDFGTQPLERQMLLSARFLHAEIPIRLAHRLKDLSNLPEALSNEPHVRRVKVRLRARRGVALTLSSVGYNRPPF